jgi:hypothetical protein
MGREDFVQMVPFGISAKRLEGSRYVVMLRRTLMRDYQRAGLVPTSDDAFNFSMWRGYLSGDSYNADTLEWVSRGSSPSSTRAATHLLPIFARSRQRFVRRSWCRFMASNGTKKQTALALCGSHFARREASGAAYPVADEIRDGREPQDRHGARS